MHVASQLEIGVIEINRRRLARGETGVVLEVGKVVERRPCPGVYRCGIGRLVGLRAGSGKTGEIGLMVGKIRGDLNNGAERLTGVWVDLPYVGEIAIRIV